VRSSAPGVETPSTACAAKRLTAYSPSASLIISM
jgi:hypothetical protein